MAIYKIEWKKSSIKELNKSIIPKIINTVESFSRSQAGETVSRSQAPAWERDGVVAKHVGANGVRPLGNEM